jgi:hypothetical protein
VKLHSYLFGSSHIGGCLFVCGDGSIRMISFSVDPTQFQWLCGRSDGQVINLNN